MESTSGRFLLECECRRAEPFWERMRKEIESRLGIVALNVYSLSEVIGPGVSVECTQKEVMHIFEDQFFSRDH